MNNIAFAVETEEEAVDKLCEHFEYELDEDLCGCDNGTKTCSSSADRWVCIKKNKRINTKFVNSRAECYKLAHFDDLPLTKMVGAMPSAICDIIAEYVSIQGYLICRADFEFSDDIIDLTDIFATKLGAIKYLDCWHNWAREYWADQLSLDESLPFEKIAEYALDNESDIIWKDYWVISLVWCAKI